MLWQCSLILKHDSSDLFGKYHLPKQINTDWAEEKENIYIFSIYNLHLLLLYFNSDYFVVFSLELTLIFKAIHQVSSQFLP